MKTNEVVLIFPLQFQQVFLIKKSYYLKANFSFETSEMPAEQWNAKAIS